MSREGQPTMVLAWKRTAKSAMASSAQEYPSGSVVPPFYFWGGVGRCGPHRLLVSLVMACIVMACIGMACTVMAYIVMAYIVMACIVMAYIVMAYIVMAIAVMICGSWYGLDVYGIYSYGLHSYGLHRYGQSCDDLRHNSNSFLMAYIH